MSEAQHLAKAADGIVRALHTSEYTPREATFALALAAVHTARSVGATREVFSELILQLYDNHVYHMGGR